MSLKNKDYAFWYFRISGLITILGALPSVISPKLGTHLSFGGMPTLTFPDEIFPIIGHWGIMVVGIGIMIYVSAKNLAFRKHIIWYSIVEKTYLVGSGLYLYSQDSILGTMYMGAIVLDSLQVLGGVYYLLKNKKP